MKVVRAFEARARLSQLLEDVAAGESVVITKHGTPVARLVPIAPAADKLRIADAIARLKVFGRRYSLGGLGLKAVRDEGRM